eukprot:3395761-Pleurochrysis_carterae.AAC.1
MSCTKAGYLPLGVDLRVRCLARRASSFGLRSSAAHEGRHSVPTGHRGRGRRASLREYHKPKQ